LPREFPPEIAVRIRRSLAHLVIDYSAPPQGTLIPEKLEGFIAAETPYGLSDIGVK